MENLITKYIIEASRPKRLEGEFIVFTGFRDASLAADIEKYGGVVKSGISGKTTILLVKKLDSTSSKAKKAKALGMKIMTPEAFIKKYKI